MIGDTKIKKTIIATLFTILLASACYITVYAASYWQQQQSIKQTVTVYGTGITYNYQLTGLVNHSDSDTHTRVLQITLNHAPANITLRCLNYGSLAANYSALVLYVKQGATILGSLDLRTADKLYIQRIATGTEWFDYTIDFTPSVVSSNNEIQLEVAIED